MLAMQYRFTLPADYDMAIVRRRIADVGHRLDACPQLIVKAYLYAQRSEGSAENLYAPFYLWNSSAGMSDFLTGEGFKGLSQAFGWPRVNHWLPWLTHFDRPHLAEAAWATCQEQIIAPYSDLPALRRQQQAAPGALVGIKALEIPTDPLTGVSLAALEMALEQWPIKAILLTPNCNNPLGYIMPDAHKQRLLTLAQRHDAAIIEDDVYGDIAYHYPRPRTIKSFDDDGRVLLCSSFSKTLAPGLRVGWIAPGRYLERVLHMKFIGSGATATQPQLAIAEFIRSGHYLQHLRRMRARYQQNRDRMTDLILKHFPVGTRVSRPRGGFMMWIELDEAFDTLRLNRHLEQQGVQIAVGSIFSAAGKYRNCLRINYAPTLTTEIEQAVQRVGATIQALMPAGSLAQSD